MRSFSGALLDSSEMNPAENSAHEQQHVRPIGVPKCERHHYQNTEVR
jgi:hypothetical protein